MPIPSPFHPRTSELCTSMLWKDWAGFYAVRSYDTYLEREYYAIRHTAGMIDVSPLFKYEVSGRDATEMLSGVMARDITRLAIGQVSYCCWCDDDGKVVDDGTVSRLSETSFRVTSAEPALAWLDRHRRAAQVEIEDVSEAIAALSVQGPASRALLSEIAGDVAELGFFRCARYQFDGVDVVVSRTGYTGDLGYELWAGSDSAVRLWDLVAAAGEPYGLLPAGLDAMDVARVEAGFIMNGVDYFSAPHCLIESRKSTPYELGLGWTVDLERTPFTGQEALRTESTNGSKWALVGLAVDWDELAKLYAAVGLPPQLPIHAERDPVPVYAPGGRQIGQATSRAWSPQLKQRLALASVESPYRDVGTHLEIEATVEYTRHRVAAEVVRKPFFDPPRKRS